MKRYIQKRYIHITVVAFSLLFGVGALSLALRSAQAAASLSITPITWNVVGLDSNNVNVGPNHFPVGARVCNIGDAPATNVTSAFVWDSANALINLRPGTLTNFNASPVASLAPSACHDFYYEVEVTRNAAAYDTTRRYHITATADVIGTVSTPTPRELYVEHLISQSRNHVLDVKLNGTSVPNGGTMALVVGQTYTIELVGSTATNGYEQLESFINFPNTIFQVLSVSTTYSADTSANVSNPNDKLYGDGCRWENDPNSPYYRSCRDVGKIGGSVNVVYQVKIIQVPGAPLVNPEPLSTLLYDFSGSSFHYNDDFGTSARFAAVVDPSTLTIAKNFSPDPTNVNGVSALTFTITNPNPAAISGVSFSDVFPTSPGAMVVANPTDATINGCGAATFSPVAGAGSISFSNGTVAANSSCTVKANVTVPAAGTYTNTSNHLFAGGIDTGKFATDTLTVNNAPPPPSPVCGSTLALWTFPTGFNINAPVPTTNNVASASASPGPGVTQVSSSNSTTTADGTLSWGSNGNISTGTPLNTANDDYFQFAIDTTNQTSVTLSFDALRKTPNGPQGLAVYSSTSTKATGATEPNPAVFNNATALPTQNVWVTFSSITVNSGLNPSGLTYFRIYAYNSGNTNTGSDINLDNVLFTGCVTPSAPTISKSFSPSPVAVGGTSTLTFTITNPNTGIALSGLAFNDTLPAGVTVTSGSSSQCGGTLTRTAPSTLAFTGGTLAAGASCNVTATVTVTTAGPHDNVSGFVTSTEGGTNTGTTGIATASITGILPPGIAKQFAPNPVLAGTATTLTFTLTNPNASLAQSGVAFSDTLPTSPGAMVVATTPAATTSGCGSPTFAPSAGSGSISFSGGTIAAGGTCIVTVNVVAPTAGSYANTSGSVSHLVNGVPTNGGTASDTLTVTPANPAIALLKQVGPTAAGPWSSFLAAPVGGNVFYRFTVENIGNVPLNSVGVTDPQVSAASCTWPSPLPVASQTADPTATCVVGPVAAVSGTHANTATASGTNGTTVTDTSTATYATTSLTLAKSVIETTYTLPGDQLHYSYLVTNSGFAALAGPVSVSDNKATVTCPAVSTVGDLDNFLDPGESITCTATYTVTAGDVTAGQVTNVASATADGATSNTDSRTVPLSTSADVSLVKTLITAGPYSVGQSISYTLVVANAGPSTATNIQVTDTPTNLTIINVSGGGCAALPCTITSLASGANTTINVTATINASGAFDNSATATPAETDPNTANNTDNTGNGGTATSLSPPSIAKSFSPNPIAVGGVSTLSFTITNPNSGTSLTGVAFTDTFPAGLQVAATPNVTTSGCGSPTFAPAAGNTSLSFSGGTIAASGTCTATVAVTPTTGGSKVNTTGNVTSTNAGTGNTGTDTLNVVSPPSIAKAFSPNPIAVGGVSTLTLTITNPNAGTSLAGVAFSDTFPAGLQVASSPNVTTSGCGSPTFAPSAGNTSLTFSGGTISASGTCTVAVNVTATTSGAKVNTTGNVSSTNGGTGNTGTDTLTVLSAPSIAKAFSPNPIAVGGVSTLTFTITNPNAGTALTGVAFTDTFPAGLQVAATPSASTSGCGSPTFTPAAGNSSLSFSGGTIATSGTCTVSVAVTATTSGSKANTTSNVTSTNGGTGNMGSDTLTVLSAPSIAKAFSPNTILVGGVSTLTFTITNPNAGTALTGVSFTDSFPAGVQVAVTPNVTTSGCGSPTFAPAAGNTSLSFSGGTIVASGTCTATVAVTATTSGTKVNTTGNVTSTNGGTGNTGMDTLTVNPVADLVVAKTDGVTSVNAGGTTTYTLTLTNNGPSAANGTTISDPAAAGLAKTALGACTAGGGAVCPAAGAGAGQLNITNLEAGTVVVPTLPSGGSISFTVTATVTATSGSVTNTLTATPPAGTTDPTPATVSDTDTVSPNPTLTKSFSPATFVSGGTTTLTFTITNTAVGAAAQTGLAFTDTLPSNLRVATPPSIVGACGGTVTAMAGGTTIALSGGTVAAGGSCTVTVNVTNVPGQLNASCTSNPAAFTNAAGNIGGLSGNLINGVVPGCVTVTAPLADLSLTKTVNRTLVNPGDTVVFTITLTNNGPNTATNVAVSDPLPSGYNCVSGSTSQGSYSCATGIWTAGTVNVGQTLTLQITATVNENGQFQNIAQVSASDQADPDSSPGNSMPTEDDQATVSITLGSPKGPGLAFPVSSEVSDQKAGSILVYNVYTSSASSPNTQNTRINLTNDSPRSRVAVHLFFVDGDTCSVADAVICLTENQTTSFLASDLDPGTTGYLIAVAVDPETGCPISANNLIGDLYVKFSSGHQANLGAEAFAALSARPAVCDASSFMAELVFNGTTGYNRVPRVLAVDSIGSRADGEDMLLILNRIGGNLGIGASTLGALFGVMYDDSEVGLSFQISGSCQLRASLTNNFPRTTPRFEQFITAGRTGWMKLFSQSSAVGILGAAIRFNPNTATSAGAFNQGHNLHKLTLTNEANVILPIFPPSCL